MPRDAFGRDHDESGPALSSSLPPTFASSPLPRQHAGHIAALFGVVVAAALVFGVVTVIRHAPSIHLPSLPQATLGSSNTPPSGLDQRSLLRRGNLAPALRRIEAKVGGRPRLVRVEADRLDVQVVAHGRLVQVQYRWDASEPDVLVTSPAPASIGAFAWAQVNASAPARIVRATTRRRRTQDFEYAVLVRADGLRWSGYTATRGGFLADAQGRSPTPIGG